MKFFVSAFLLFLIALSGDPAFAWGAKGHEYVGAIADQLVNDRAKHQIEAILGYDLETASTWADCVRSVTQTSPGTFEYQKDPRHPEYTAACAAFETPSEKARMEDYASRNWDNCTHEVGHGCHESYHFADVDEQHDHYDRGYVGTSDHDIVGAIDAAVAVLMDKPAPAPFSIKDKKEALLLLTHLVGDLHQPLHVGAIYLSSDGSEIDPDVPGADAVSTQTRGGNSIRDASTNLHSEWDQIPDNLGVQPSSKTLYAARAIPATPVPVDQLAAVWASDTIKAAHGAFAGITYTGNGPHRWTASFENRGSYNASKEQLQTEQLVRAGAHLTEVLDTIWP